MNQLELHYQITRNTETLESYRAWVKHSGKESRVGLLTAIALLFYCAAMVAYFFSFNQRGAPPIRLSLFFIGAVLLAVGQWRLWRYRRSHPWSAEAVAPPRNTAG